MLLKKGVYPDEYMDSWERFNETTLPNKEALYSELYLEDINDEDYTHAQKVFQEFSIKNLRQYLISMFKVIHYCLQKYLKILEINVLKCTNLIMFIFICT